MDFPELLTVQEAAEIRKCSVVTLYRMIKRDEIKATDPPIRIFAESLRKHILCGGNRPKPKEVRRAS